MTERDAILALFECAADCVRGAGTGIGRPALSEHGRREIQEAVKRLWNRVYDYNCGDNELRNMGLHP